MWFFMVDFFICKPFKLKITLKFAYLDEGRTLSSKWLGLGVEEGIYRRGPLVPVGDRNRD